MDDLSKGNSARVPACDRNPVVEELFSKVWRKVSKISERTNERSKVLSSPGFVGFSREWDCLELYGAFSLHR